MAKQVDGFLKLQVRGGQANPAPPVGPALGSKGINIMEFCNQFNARTDDRKGQVLPVVITIYKDKSFDFVIKTPPGYSCLFTAPLNNRDDRFETISGIVDTDIYDNHINFPIILNGDKYPSLETTIERGTPYVQIIPFKRNDWKIVVEERQSPIFLERVNIFRKLWNNYKTFFWKKKKWN